MKEEMTNNYESPATEVIKLEVAPILLDPTNDNPISGDEPE